MVVDESVSSYQTITLVSYVDCLRDGVVWKEDLSIAGKVISLC